MFPSALQENQNRNLESWPNDITRTMKKHVKIGGGQNEIIRFKQQQFITLIIFMKMPEVGYILSS